MKITANEPAFETVVITLETQEEVDELFAVFNFRPIIDALSRAFDNGIAHKLYQGLKKYQSLNCAKFHDILSEAWKKGYSQNKVRRY